MSFNLYYSEEEFDFGSTMPQQESHNYNYNPLHNHGPYDDYSGPSNPEWAGEQPGWNNQYGQHSPREMQVNLFKIFFAF